MPDATQDEKGLKAVIPEKLQPWVGRAAAGLGIGSGISLAFAAIQAIRQHPEFLSTLTGGSVLIFSGAIIFLVIFDRRLKSFGDMQMRNVVAQEQMAERFGEFVEATQGQQEERIAAQAALRFVSAAVEDIQGKVNQLYARTN
jgi:hypothetical protein